MSDSSTLFGAEEDHMYLELPQHFQGKSVQIGNSRTATQDTFSMQDLVMGQAVACAGTAEVLTDADVPRLKKTVLTKAVFRDICSLASSALQRVH